MTASPIGLRADLPIGDTPVNRRAYGPAKVGVTETLKLAGISVPATPLIERALDYAHEACEPHLYNHVVRSWLFAERIGLKYRPRSEFFRK
jgi:hypothetical protein